MRKHSVLIVDDEADLRFTLGRFLRSNGFDVLEAGDARSARAVFDAMRPDVAIVDYALPDENALVLLPTLKAIDPNIPLLVLTGHGTIDLAVQAVKMGAENFLTKPIELPALNVILRRLVESQRDRRGRVVRETVSHRKSIDPFLGTSKAIQRLGEHAKRIMASESPILIQGETGTGKSVLARWLHENGPRGSEPFVDINCAGLEREFFETELFGHEKGAYTGAIGNKPGLLEIAHKGTVFLDEIGDVSLQVQPKLLKVLEEKRFRRMGGIRDNFVDIRLIAATHQDLAKSVVEKQFREDLFFRISAIPLTVPPLRERDADVPILAELFLAEFSTELKRARFHLHSSALDALKEYSWPGNIRELRNVLERAVLLGETSLITANDLKFHRERESPRMTVDTTVSLVENERRFIELVLAEENGRVETAARRLGIVRSALYKKLKKHGITNQ